MTEEDAKAALNVSGETLERLGRFVDLLRSENSRQNLVSHGTLPTVWARHILDSAQLLRFAPVSGDWLDLGTGAGFPGLVVAALRDQGLVTMVESRRLRVEFLQRAAEILVLGARAEIVCGKVEALPPRPYGVISARAFAPLDKLLRLGLRFSDPNTVWILPKGKNAQSELEGARSSWQGDFRIEPSVTDAEAGIIVAQGVKPKRNMAR
ncbi:MAG TPA: 16S rRNA (guanine(527)-N(7))-methyltransferase RsmG [Allosphingosinicella sp.]|nr:16S rRNA (guanine(527)-N(7))-methyltransferase RsmG [Allosphingosinicella sp.]